LNNNLYQLFEERFSAELDRACMLDEQGKVMLSYRGLQKQSAEIAGVLSNLGIKRGDRVVAQIEKSPLGVALYLACLRKGVIYIPLNTAYTSAELQYFLQDSTAKLLVCDPEKLEALEPLAHQCKIDYVLTAGSDGNGSLLQMCFAQLQDTHIESVDENTVAAILYTSGTTGAAKGAMLTHGNLISNVQTLHQLWGWEGNDILLHALPVFHVHGLFVGVNLSLFNASSMIFLPKFELDQVLDSLPQATVFMGVPTFYSRMLNSERLSTELCASMRLFISGSAPLRPEHFETFQQRTGHSILERYGMTEAGMITSNPLAGRRIPGTVGYTLPGVSARVVSKHEDELGPEEIGQLQIKGPNVFNGYWQKPEKTRQEFTRDGYFRTGDLCTISGDGRITIVGRDKDMIISGGFNIYPSEIESRIMEIAGVTDCAVFGLPHPDFGESVAAVIITEESATVTEQLISTHLSSVLARFKQPKKILFSDALPRNAMGKVQKKILRDRYGED
jgi:malonyl-CoA/methylmalonyl-CoA synthetase